MSTPTQHQLAALVRLWRIANGHSGQCRRVAAFLLGLYNGPRFPFDLTNVRCVDAEILQDMITVLVMDASPQQEVHIHLTMLLPNEKINFEQLAETWGLTRKQRRAA